MFELRSSSPSLATQTLSQEKQTTTTTTSNYQMGALPLSTSVSPGVHLSQHAGLILSVTVETKLAARLSQSPPSYLQPLNVALALPLFPRDGPGEQRWPSASLTLPAVAPIWVQSLLSSETEISTASPKPVVEMGVFLRAA